MESIFKIDINNLFDSYTMIYLFWLFIIVLLKIISNYTNFKEDNDV